MAKDLISHVQPAVLTSLFGALSADQGKCLCRAYDFFREPILLNHPDWNIKLGHDVTHTNCSPSKPSMFLVSHRGNNPLRVLWNCLLCSALIKPRRSEQVSWWCREWQEPIVVVAKSKDQMPRPNAQAEKDTSWIEREHSSSSGLHSPFRVPPGHGLADILYSSLCLRQPFEVVWHSNVSHVSPQPLDLLQFFNHIATLIVPQFGNPWCIWYVFKRESINPEAVLHSRYSRVCP